MDPKYVTGFNAVVNCIEDLWSVFGSKKATPLALYRRLISHIKFTDAEAINKSLSGFRQFLMIHDDYIINDELEKIPRGTVIKYGTNDRVYIDIQKYIYQSDKETKEAIRQHLITISAILDPNDKKITELEKKASQMLTSSNSKEGEFISGIMSKAKNVMQQGDMDNPTQAIAGIFKSGLLQEMISGLQEGVESGELSQEKLMSSMQGLTGMMSSNPDEAGSSE